MKALFVGDVHNHMYIFDDVERLDKDYNFDKIIFLGDYVDDWGTDNHDSLRTLEKVFSLKNSNPLKYIFIVGNHEYSYIGHRCSGYMEELSDVVKQKIRENIDLFDFYYKIDLDNSYICSHAGLVNSYIQYVLYSQFSTDDYVKALEQMNNEKLKYLELLNYCSFKRGGRSLFGSFIWADRMDHLSFTYFDEDPICKYQIMGHSPVQSIYEHGKDKYNYYFIDTHSTYKNGTPYGDKSYLVWNEDKFKIVY